jgi:hypothetical protein
MEALLQDSRICRRTKQAARRSANKKRQAKGSAAQFNRNGFLNHSFQPLTDNKQLLEYQNKAERSYFNSLNNLSALYQFEPLDVSDKVYPYNIHLSYEYASRWMNIIYPDTKLVIINDERRTASLATVKVYDTGTCLYYIPVKPLFKLLRKKKYKTQAELLTSVFAYLYQQNEVAYYGNDKSYLYYSYEAIEQWVDEAREEWEDEEFRQLFSEIKAQKFIGEAIEKKIKLPYQLMCFEERVNRFVVETDFDKSLLDIASKCFELYKEYPDRKINDSIQTNILAPNEEDSISIEQYLSFFWSGEGFLYDQVMDYVNSSLQELPTIDEPMSVQFFDTPQITITHQFQFEEKFFALVHELCDLLNLIE